MLVNLLNIKVDILPDLRRIICRDTQEFIGASHLKNHELFEGRLVINTGILLQYGGHLSDSEMTCVAKINIFFVYFHEFFIWNQCSGIETSIESCGSEYRKVSKQ